MFFFKNYFAMSSVLIFHIFLLFLCSISFGYFLTSISAFFKALYDRITSFASRVGRWAICNLLLALIYFQAESFGIDETIPRNCHILPYLPYPHSHHTYPNVVGIMSVFFHKQRDAKTSQVKNVGRDHRFNVTAIGSQNWEAKYQFVMKWNHIYIYFFHSLCGSSLTSIELENILYTWAVWAVFCTCAKDSPFSLFSPLSPFRPLSLFSPFSVAVPKTWQLVQSQKKEIW